MQIRFKIPRRIQIRYLLRLEKISGKNINDIAKLFGIVPRSYRDWKRGKYPLTRQAVELIESKYNLNFPYSRKKAFTNWRRAKLKASSKGGFERSKIYGSPGTPEGRRKGGIKAIALLRAKGLAVSIKSFNPPKTSIDLAEFVGIMLGDGHLDSGSWRITLNSKADRKYIPYAVSLINSVFQIKPKIFKRIEDNTTTIYFYGILCSKFLQKIGLKIGDKVKQQVGIPEWIQRNQSFSHACLRGLMDTDGGIFIHSYKVNGKKYSYSKLCFVNRSIPLLKFTYNSLSNIGLNPKLIDRVENKRVWLYNMHEVSKYLEIIGTHNPRLSAKMKFSKEDGPDGKAQVC